MHIIQKSRGKLNLRFGVIKKPALVSGIFLVLPSLLCWFPVSTASSGVKMAVDSSQSNIGPHSHPELLVFPSS